jgi:small subunit ribosomal protein S16
VVIIVFSSIILFILCFITNSMLTIRFARTGKRNKAQFKILLQEHTVAPGGRHVEVLGAYDPHSKQAVLKEERIKYWLSKGATASDTAHNLLVSKGLISEKKRAVKLPAKAKEEAVAKEGEASVPAEKVEEQEAPQEAKPEEEPKELETKPE